MDEDIFETIKRQQEFDKLFPHYPCKNCGIKDRCKSDERGKQCHKWVNWFSEEWRKIRKYFLGGECDDKEEQ